ncbi:MATE family efflux transporter [Deinococcus yavapaiensis]|uniref:MATE family efflux transporter n=1 Tax=Deinococcus yavapaiensis TaxID=309889 RepID=UPI001FE8BF57|nr:MATE family efflux transporter [Deinococcus yavapaiensis]
MADVSPSDSAPSGRTRELLTLAGPLMFSNLAYTAVGFTDTLIVGRIGVAEVGAVGFAGIVLLTILLLFRGSLNTAATFVARALGSGDRPGVRRWAGVFLTLSLIGVPLAFAGPWIVDVAFALLQPDPVVARIARAYAHVRIFETPFVLIGTVSLSIMVGLGNTRTPMVLAWLVMILNAVLASLFVFVFGWGVRGAAWAALVAVIVQQILAFALLHRLHGGLFGGFPFLRPRRAEMASFARVSLPVGVTELGEVSAFTAFQGVISRLGATELAASQIANQLASLGFLPAFALSAATGSLVSRALGARRTDVAAKVGWRGAGIAAAFMSVLGALFLLFPRQLLGVFNGDAGVLRLGVPILAVMAAYQILDGVAIVLGGALGGAGDTRFRLVVTMTGSWIVMVLGSVFLAARFGVTGAWAAALLYMIVAALAYVWRFRSGRWQGRTL